MPELPEVETVRGGLAPALVGARLVSAEARRPDLRFPLPERFVERLTGRRVEALRRRAKYLLADLDDGTVLVMHLGMSGSFRVDEAAPDDLHPARPLPPCPHHVRSHAAAHDHIVFTTDRGARITYNDPRRFGFMTLIAAAGIEAHPLFRDLGIEPLGNEMNAAALSTAFAGRRTSLKAALLDQHLIAGLGNIYVCEALYRAHLSPLRQAGTLASARGAPNARTERLAVAIPAVLREAVAAGGSSLRDHARTTGELGYFQHSFRAYGREHAPCLTPGCRGTVRRIVQGARSTFYCPVCQT